MEHLIYRCKHCNKEYVYCTYGNGEEYGTEKHCTREYCGECGKAIQDALSNIPIKIEGRKQLITDSKEFDRINAIFDKCKNEFKKEYNTINACRIIPDLGYKSVEGCYINKVEYHRCINDNGIVHIYVFKEFDLINNKFTNKKYFQNNNPCERYFPLTQLKFSDINFKEKKLEAPTGKIWFDDFS